MKVITKGTLKTAFVQTSFVILFINIMVKIFGPSLSLPSVSSVTALLLFYYLPLNLSAFSGALLAGTTFFMTGFVSLISLFTSIEVAFLLHFFTLLIMMWLFSPRFELKLFMPYLLLLIFTASQEASTISLRSFIVFLISNALLITLVYFFKHRSKKYEVYQRLPKRLTANFSFVFKMSLGVSLALFFGKLWHLPKAMWIAMTVMSLTQIEKEVTKQRLLQRVSGSLLGILSYLLLFHWLIPASFHLFTVLCLTFIYSFVTHYRLQLIFITINVLYASALPGNLIATIQHRLLFIALGIIILMLIELSIYGLTQIKNYRYSSENE